MADSLPPGFITGVAKVSGSNWITPILRRLTLAAPEIAALELGDSPGTGIRVLIAAPGSPVVMPTPSVEGLVYPPGVEPLITRTLTVRRNDPVGSTLDVEVITDHDGVLGQWAAAVEIGDQVGFAGPKHFPPLPADGPLVLVGDQSAVPAIASILEMQADTNDRPVNVFIEVESADNEVDLGLPTTWLHRSSQEVGSLLVPALANLEIPADAVVWLAGEAQMVRSIRAALLARDPAPSQVRACGYWRSGTSSTELDDGLLRVRQELMARGESLEVLDEFALSLDQPS